MATTTNWRKASPDVRKWVSFSNWMKLSIQHGHKRVAINIANSTMAWAPQPQNCPKMLFTKWTEILGIVWGVTQHEIYKSKIKFIQFVEFSLCKIICADLCIRIIANKRQKQQQQKCAHRRKQMRWNLMLKWPSFLAERFSWLVTE